MDDLVRFAPNQKLPPGYVVRYSDGHTYWEETATERTGLIHWNRWASWRGAWADFRKRVTP